MLIHDVFFTLKDQSAAGRQKLMNACQQLLTDHPGTKFFACGTVSDLDRDLNDRDFDVGLHIVFADRASHDRYQTSERHVRFIEENRGSWTKVRVFDTDA
ncbi:MAG: Dabb family protein [Planctomycetia bacterium]|nr:Dabb family protein [Planctomycetia bacterium]